MHLDETVLQSRTTLTLVEFIEELWKYMHTDWYDDEDIDELEQEFEMNRLLKKYEEITAKADKAKSKRSFP